MTRRISTINHSSVVMSWRHPVVRKRSKLFNIWSSV